MSAETIYRIEPPPETAYECHDQAEAALHAWTKSHGFNVSRRRARRNDNGDICIRNYECDRSGKSKNTRKLTNEERVRTKRGSKRCNCPMRIYLHAVVREAPSGGWKIVYTGNGSAVHNHKASSDVRVHAAHRQRSAQAVVGADTNSVTSLQGLIEAQSAAGVPVANIYATILGQDPESLVIPKDIANSKNPARRRVLATDTPMEALFKDLQNQEFFYRFDLFPQSQRLKYLFWAHPKTSQLFKSNSDILVMDCTYKTNKFDLPLLNVVALTGMNTVLPICQAWLPGEQNPDYIWDLNMLRLLMLEFDVPEPRVILHDRDQALMNALAAVFPDEPTIVCRWHMNKNVLSKTREVLGNITVANAAPGQPKSVNTLATDRFMALFYRTVDSASEEELQVNKAALVRSNPLLAAYLEKHWWKYEDKIVKVGLDTFMHFGIRDTSVVEGTHTQSKRWVKSTRGDLISVFRKLLPRWASAANSTREQLCRNETIVPQLLQYTEFDACVRIITNSALYEADTLWNETRRIIVNDEARTNCSGAFRVVHGRPCVHELMTIIESEGRLCLMPDQFDKHWWIQSGKKQQQESAARVLDPPPARGKKSRKARPSSHKRNYGETGTARDQAYFERLENNDSTLLPTTFSAPDATVFGTQNSDTDPSMLQQVQTLPSFTNVFHQSHTPARSWRYAGTNPYS